MKNWKVELKSGRKSLAEMKIRRAIIQGNVLHSFLFLIAMMPINPILMKATSE